MINTITTIREQNVWITLCHLEAGHHYKVAYVPTEITKVELHVHTAQGEHKLAISRPGTSAMKGFTYSHKFLTSEGGELVARIDRGELTNIVVEEIDNV